MKINLLFVFCCFVFSFSMLSAQSVGIGINNPDSSALLDISSTTQGVLMPRMTTSQRDAIVSPAIGLQILNTDDFCIDIYDGAHWIKNCGMRIVGMDNDPLWTQKADFPGAGPGRVHAIGIGLNGKGYVGTGVMNGVYYNDFWEYDPATNAWTQKADFPGSPRARATGFALGNKLYIGTGQDANALLLNDFWEYDPATNSWTQKANVPGASRDQAFGFSVLGKGYIGAGDDIDFWEYNPGTNQWTQKANFPYYGDDLVTFVVGDYGYAGIQSNDDWNEDMGFYRYDPYSDSWSAMSPFPGQLRKDAVAFEAGYLGYVGCGESQYGAMSDFWVYYPNDNRWLQIQDMPATPRAGAVGFAIDERGFVGTGEFTPYEEFPSDLWEYNPFHPGPIYENTFRMDSVLTVSDGAWTRNDNRVFNRVEFVGIGTHVPTSSLDIQSFSERTGSHPTYRPLYVTGNLGERSEGIEFRHANGTQGIGLGYNTIYATGSNVNQSLGLASRGSGHLAFSIGDTERMRIDSVGRVSIGHDDPLNALDIFSGAYRLGVHPNGLAFYATADLTEAGNGMELRTNDALFGIGLGSTTIYAAGSSLSQDIKIKAKGADGDIAFLTNDVQQMQLSGSGRLALGSGLTAANKLDISNGTRTGSHSSNMILYATGNMMPEANGVEFRHTNGTEGIGFGTNTIYTTGTNASQNLGFKARGSAGNLLFSTNLTERMRIDANGNIGIGLTSASNFVDIRTSFERSGSHNTGMALYITGDLQEDSDGVEFRTYNAQKGIGFGSTTIYAAGSNASQDLKFKTKGAGNLVFMTPGNVRAVINSNGYFGIGTNITPTNKLDIFTIGRTGTHATNLALYATADMQEDGNGAEFRHFDGTQGIGFGYNTMYAAGTNENQDLKFKSKGSTGTLVFLTSNTTRAVISGTGDFGIGSSTPLNKLDITTATRSGTHATGLPLYVTSPSLADSNGVEFRHINGTQGIGFGFNTIYATGSNANQDLKLKAKGAGGLAFITNGALRVTINSAGNVGMGTATPNAPLQFASAAADRKIVLWEFANNNHQFIGFGITGTHLKYQVNSTLSDHVFFAAANGSASNELLRIKGTGNVTIAGVIETESFIAPTLLNAFVNTGGEYAVAGYYKDKMGIVRLRGRINNAGDPDNLNIFQLPAGYRPPTNGRLSFSVLNNGALCQVDILPDGSVKVISGSIGWISLDQISFKAE